MTDVFADTVYWIALTRPRDDWRDAAERALEALPDPRTVTTDEVLTEFLTAMSGAGPYLRQQAVNAVRRAITNPNITVLPQARRSFLNGLDRYERRLDKGYSLVDCVSMNAMEQHGITAVLSADHRFEQDGFTALMKRSDV